MLGLHFRHSDAYSSSHTQTHTFKQSLRVVLVNCDVTVAFWSSGLQSSRGTSCVSPLQPKHLHHWPFQTGTLVPSPGYVCKAKANIQWFISFGSSSTSSQLNWPALGKDKASAWALGGCCGCPPSSLLSHCHTHSLYSETTQMQQRSKGISLKRLFGLCHVVNLEYCQTHWLSHLKW